MRRVRSRKLGSCRYFLKVPGGDTASPPRFDQRPSVITAFRTPLKLRDALFLVISQSGRSPDLVAATRSARNSGARTVAIVNATSSPVSDEAEFVIPIEAGEERSVAATKSVIGSMAAGAGLVAELAEDPKLRSALDRLPERLQRALALDWSMIAGICPQHRPCLSRRAAWGLAQHERSLSSFRKFCACRPLA